MSEYRYGGYTVSHLTVHQVWVTKYRYKVLPGYIQKRCRELLIQVCDTEDVRILSGVVSKDLIHITYRISAVCFEKQSGQTDDRSSVAFASERVSGIEWTLQG